MPTFEPGDYANLATTNGEITVNIKSDEMNGCYRAALYENEMFTGRVETVHASRLRALRGPYFDIRGQVLTTSSSHPEVGEIVGTGTSKSGKTLFRVQFGDGTSEWFNEDQVFIDDEVKRAHDEATKDK